MKSESLRVWRLHPDPVAPFDLTLPVRIGRHPTSELRFADDDVSRFHATLEMRDGRAHVVDHGSRNGGYVNGPRVGVAPQPAGAVLRLGQTVLWFGAGGAGGLLAQRVADEATRTQPLVLVVEPGSGRRT